ncbi:MAG: hypothetical protein WAV10_03860 [Minisyncoccia bacterium]
MKSQSKICQNCKKDFLIEEEDFNFYEKIKVPPPTFCPECRTIRRLCWRNEMSLFKRKCNGNDHNESIISIYHPDEKIVVYDLKYWWSDKWDPMVYGQDYDFNKPFFEQWKKLRDSFPLQCLSNSKSVNSDYCNVADESKNSYMSSGSWKIEQTFYSNRIYSTKDSSDLYMVHKSELCYDDVICSDCYHVLYSLNCKNCVDSYFLYDCHGCVNCFGCSNLRNKSYCMWNEQLSREEYNNRLAKFNLRSYNIICEFKQRFQELYFNSIHKFATQIKTVNSTGENLEGVKNCKICFDSSGKIEDSKYIHWAKENLKDTYDSGPGVGVGELMYEVFDTGMGNFRNLFTSVVYTSNDIEYCFNCYGSSNLFGCIGLRNKNYCILNKQYTEEEYKELIPKIRKHMDSVPFFDKRGLVYKYGEFFPVELSLFAYNETVAQDYFPIKKDEAIEIGYKWRDKKTNEYKITKEAKNVQDSLDDITDSIIEEIICCLHNGKCGGRCSGAFKITKDELDIYRRIGVPLPRLCFFCRHEDRLKMRNPMKLWHRQCMCDKENHNHEGRCEVEFETSYSPDKPEIVYCEKCYQKEVY